MADATTRVLGIIIAIAGILLLLSAFYLLKTQSSNDIIIKKKTKGKNYLNFINRFYKSVPFLSKYYVKTRNHVEIIYPSDEVTISQKTSKILAIRLGIVIVGTIITLMISGGSIYFMMLGITMVVITSQSIHNLIYKNMHLKILEEMQIGLKDIRHSYHNSPRVEAALNNSINQSKGIIRLHFKKLLKIIQHPHMKDEIVAYVGTEPNHFMLMLLQIVAAIREFGDVKLEDNNSLFLTDLNYLKEEVNSDILYWRRNNNAFRLFGFFSILPVFLLKPFQLWADYFFPDIAVYYDGFYGAVAMMGIFIVSILIHNIIVDLRDGSESIEKFDDIWKRLSNKKPIKRFITKYFDKHYVKYEKLNDMKKGLQDHTGPNALIMKQFGYAVITLIATLFILSTAMIQHKYNQVYQWGKEFQDVVTPNEAYKDSMKEFGIEYMETLKGLNISREELVDDIMTNTPIKKQQYAEILADKILAKLNTYNNAYFKWYFILIAYACSVAAFYVPVLGLKFKKTLIEQRKDEEVNRFQSIMLILMNFSGTDLQLILEWMQRFSYCFKDEIIACRIGLPHGKQKALQKMKENTHHEGFKDFTDNLLAIDNVGVKQAFDEIISDRDYYQKNREEERIEGIKKRSGEASFLIMIPTAAMVVFYVLIPLGMYVFNMYQELRVALGF